jgi:hypothetical protein
MWDPHAALDTIIQSSTVDLFHACSVAVAPLERSGASIKATGADRLLGTIEFNSPSMKGSVTLSVPGLLFAIAVAGGERKPSSSDWIRELTNQLVGRVKRRLAQFQVSLQAGLPSLPTQDRLRRLQSGSSSPNVYEFRALRGEIIVVLDATIDYSALRYSGTLKLPNEGDIILF